ncbi:hypothetical protein [Luteitalea sp.]
MATTSSPPLNRLARWPFAVLVAWACLLVWGLAGRQPASWPDPAAPWFLDAQARLPLVSLLDRSDLWLGLGPDVSPAAALVFVLIGLTSLTIAMGLGVTPPMALAASGALLATRSAWGSVTPGHDASALLLVSVGVLTVALPSMRHIGMAGLLVGAPLAAPTAAWAMTPAVAGWPATGRARRTIAFAGVALALASSALMARVAWADVSCLSSAPWWGRLEEVLYPALSTGLSPWTALRQLAAVLAGDVHPFGLVVAALGLVTGGTETLSFRRLAGVAVGAGLAVAAAGVLPPAHAAGLLLPWWAPCFGLGLQQVVDAAAGRWRGLVVVFAVTIAVGAPVLRHVTVVPGPWALTTPQTMRAMAPEWTGGVVVAADAASRRRLHGAGVVTLPVDSVAIQACLANGQRVHALGASIGHLEALGFRADDRPLTVPLSAMLRDLRAGARVALAAAPGALVWAGPPGLSALTRLGVHAATVPATAALGAIASADVPGGRVAVARDGVQVDLDSGEDQPPGPVPVRISADVRAGEARIAQAGRPLVRSAHVAISVFDTIGDPVFRTTARPSPGLPVAVATQPQWRHAVIVGEPSCRVAGASAITMPPPAGRISVPLDSASRARPVVVYLASDTRPEVEVSGADSAAVAMEQERFDLTAGDTARLETRTDADAVDRAALGPGRFIVRIQLRPSGIWPAPRVSIIAGGSATTWLVRLPPPGYGAAPSTVCRYATDGLRVLRGQSTVIDDETAQDVILSTRDGWHPAEQAGGAVFQWTGHQSATATFRAEASRPRRLILDVVGADPGTGPQPVTVRVNGVVVRAAWQGAGRLEIPVGVLRSGENELTLEVPQVVAPPHDSRALGVLVRGLRLIDPGVP